MQKFLFCILFVIASAVAHSQCVTNLDLSTWHVGSYPSNGNWSVQNGGSEVLQTINGSPTFFYSPFDLMNVHVSGTFRSFDLDDDWMGFVFSFLNPLGATDSFDCWLFDWKDHIQGNSPQGMALSRAYGVIPPSMYGYTFEDHNNNAQFTVVQNTFGGPGWGWNNSHNFDLYLTYTHAVIYIDGNPTFDVHDCFKPGRFGFYNDSQADCLYNNFQYSLYIDFSLPDRTCVNLPTTFTFANTCVTSLGQYQSVTWNYGDGTPSQTINNPALANVNGTHTYTTGGTYTVTFSVTDNNGCTATASHTIDVGSPIVLDSSSTEPLCNGAANGTISVSPTGGFGNYTYSWNGGANIQQTLTGITAGTYSVTVTDGTCTTSAQYTVNQPTALTATTSHTDAPCGANGTATITINGGTPPYTGVNWAGTPSASGMATSMPAGTWIADFHDANGCSALLQYRETISQLPCGISTSVTTTNVSCYGGNNGTATLTVTGGTGTPTITWTSGASGATATGLAAGTYTYAYSDADPAHSFTGSVNITQPGAVMAVQITTIPITCTGANNGEALASVISGGNPPYSYAWSSGSLNSPSANNLPPGGVSVTVTDNSGCTASASGTISGVPSLTVALTPTIDSCFHSGKGNVFSTVSGGAPPYIYEWSNFTQDTAALNVIAGTYFVTVTDNNGCSAIDSATVTGPSAPLTAPFTKTDATCGGNTGTTTVSPAGGMPGYTFAWTPNTLSGASQTNLVAGIYSFTVNDSYGCIAFGIDTIRQPDTLLTVTDTATNVTCYGANNGTITIAISGGTTPYTYQSFPVPANDTLRNLSAGVYSGTVVDSVGCSVSLSDTITEPAPQSLTVGETDEPCFGATQGRAYAAFINPTGAPAYNWTGGQTGDTIYNLPVGTYTVTATDANGCSLIDSTTISQPAAVLLDVDTTGASCYGGNGTASVVTPASGTPPFNYAWSDSSVAGQTVSLPAGNYSVSSTDANTCQQTASFTINQPPQILIQETQTNELCYGDSGGSITLIASGGTGTNYTYTWQPNVSTDNTASGLAAGTYNVIVTDEANCTQDTSFTITQPAQIYVNAVADSAHCFGENSGAITVADSGGTSPYSYVWNDATATQNRTAIPAGDYQVTVTDANSCSASADVEVYQPQQLISTDVSIDANCYGSSDGSIVITGAGGSPAYTYSLSGGGQNTTGAFTGLSAGSYSFTVTDANNCSITDTVSVNQPDSLIISTIPVIIKVNLGETAQLQATANQQGNTVFTWQPDFGLSCYDCANPLFSGNSSVAYTVTATTDRGCTASTVIDVTVVPSYNIFIPNAFAPNGSGENAEWRIFGNLTGIKQFSVMVFNRWGEKMYESNDISSGWDGTYKGQPAPQGVYTYTAKFVWLDNHSDSDYKGSITLLR